MTIRSGGGGRGDGRVSIGNSSTTLLTASSIFTGQWEDVSGYDSVLVAVKTDQDGTFTIQFSPDASNADSTLTRYYRTAQIEPPHRFTITRKYCRVVFTNTSSSDQTYLRLQTMYGSKTELNAPTDSNLAQDFDAIAVRPTSFNYEVALGRRQGWTTWNKFGYNSDVDLAATETIWAPGGLHSRMTSADTLDVVSSSTSDDGDPAGVGAQTILIYGVDENWDTQTEAVTLNGTTTVTTTNQWLGVNRVAITSSGSSLTNVGNITLTATGAASVQAYIPAGEGVTQQAIFFVSANHQFLADWLQINVLKISGGGSPRVTIKGWVFSAVVNTWFEVFRKDLDTGVENTAQLIPSQPFVIGEKSILEFRATTDTNNTVVNCRFSGVLVRDVDG